MEHKFTNLITKYMERKGISDQHLADKIGLRRESVFRWRNGSIKSPKQEKIKECAPVLSLTSEELDELLAAANNAKSRRSGKSEPRWPEEITFSKDEPIIPVTTRPIAHPRQFFGHNALLKEIFQAWNRTALEHVFITGPAHSGKTSLLNYIRKIHHAKFLRSGQRRDWLKTDYNWVYMNFADARMQRQESFLSYVLNKLKLSKHASDLVDFSEILEEKLDKPTIFLMDNIEKGLNAKDLDDLFWGHIRAMGQNCGRIQIGFCGTSRLSADKFEEESIAVGKPSPFLNILAEIKLGPVSEEEARELIACSPKPFSPKDTDWILEQSERWPVLLQLLCKARLAALEENTTAWKQAVSNRIKFHKGLLTPAKNRTG
ncbi:MAG: XRE family transcriptional regulator [Gammaproteobacteria bacterium]|nr:XRE family transcriptional regulator [Gammaproteobacteria bacterium]